MGSEYSVEMLGINKAFGGIKALNDVSFRVKHGEIHALVGENGAGKSTLMKILSGAYQKDSGQIILAGTKIEAKSTVEMRRAGLGIIYQEFALAPHLTVAENIFINNLADGKGIISWKKLYKKSAELINNIGFNLNPKDKVENLSVAFQQIVEIAKALNENVKVLVLDEPTAVLSPYETLRLFEILRNLKKNGTSIIYISHRLDEVFELADSITVLRDGEVQDTLAKDATNINEIITLMIGKSLNAMYPKRTPKIGNEVLRVRGLSRGNKVNNVEFSVSAGEILGIAGLVGSGKTETARLVFGADNTDSGEIYIEGKPVKIKNPLDAVKNGIAYLPENRKEHGVILSMKIRENITLPVLRKMVKGAGIIDRSKENDTVNTLIEQLNIKAKSGESKVLSLSGGNQQKVSIAKWLNIDKKVIFLDEPTRGVDVGAKSEIYNIINQLTQEGLAVVFVSSEIEEVIGMSDRVIILSKGVVRGCLNKDEITKENILSLSVGHKIIDKKQEGIRYDCQQ